MQLRSYKKMSYSKRIALAFVSCFVILAMTICGTALYLTDSDFATNTVTVGDIKIDLLEPSWEDTDDIVPNQELPKNPQIKNIGINDAIVFMTVEVPVENITVTADDGTKGAKARNELFWFKDTADGASTHANNFDSNWVHLDTRDTGTDLNSTSRTYVFAYKAPISRNEITTPLFDKIQVKNYIEGEIAAGKSEDIFINAFGIQASNVLESDVDLTTNLTSANLTKIYDTFITQSGYSLMHYYSSLDLAVSDANALTTDNADLPTKDGAACALHINGNTARLELLKDVTSNKTVTLTQNTIFNMANNKLQLGNNCSFIAQKNLDIMNGKIHGNYKTMLGAVSGVVRITNLEVKTTINIPGNAVILQSREAIVNGLDIDLDASESANTLVALQFAGCERVTVDDCNINIHGVLPQRAAGLALNRVADSEINNTTISTNTTRGTRLDVVNVANCGNVKTNNSTINIQGTVPSATNGYFLSTVTKSVIDNATINVNVSQDATGSGLAGIYLDEAQNTELMNSTVSINSEYTGNAGNGANYGIYANAESNIQIKESNISVNTGDTSSYNIGVDICPTNSVKILNSEITVLGNAKGETSLHGVYNLGNCEMTSTDVKADFTSFDTTSRAFAVRCGNSETTTPVSLKINGGKLFAKNNYVPNGEGDSSGSGVTLCGTARAVIGDSSTETVISGGNNAIQVNDASSVDVYSGLFKSTNHGGMYVNSTGDVNIHGGTFQNITDSNDPNYSSQIRHFGGLYAYSNAGKVNISNATIIGGKHGLRIKENGGNSAYVTIDNSSVSGEVNAFSIDNGTLEIGSGVTTTYSSQDVCHNGGNVIDHRN